MTTRAESGKTREGVDGRLRRAAELSRAAADSWPPLVDMSRAAVTERLRTCAEVSALAWALYHAGASKTHG